MTAQRMKVPGADHPITIERNPSRVVVRLDGRVLASSTDALMLREANYRPVQYIPRKDVDMTMLERTDHATHCPYKGDASYFTAVAGGSRVANAAWSYEAPYGAVAAIAGHIAFYPERVDSIEESEPAGGAA